MKQKKFRYAEKVIALSVFAGCLLDRRGVKINQESVKMFSGNPQEAPRKPSLVLLEQKSVCCKCLKGRTWSKDAVVHLEYGMMMGVNVPFSPVTYAQKEECTGDFLEEIAEVLARHGWGAPTFPTPNISSAAHAPSRAIAGSLTVGGSLRW